MEVNVKTLMKSVLIKWLFWTIVILFLEFSFGFMMFDSFLKTSIINIFFYSLIVSSFLCLLTSIFNGKIANIISYIMLGILWLLFSTQLVFYKTLKSFFSFSVIGISDQLGSFVGETFRAIGSCSIFLIIFALPIIAYIFLRKKLNYSFKSLKEYAFNLLMIIASLACYIVCVNTQKRNDMSIWTLYYKINDNALNVEKMGVLASYNLDLYRAIFGFSEDFVKVPDGDDKEKETKYDDNVQSLDFNKATTNNEIKSINEYMINDSGTTQNEYTGRFAGYNLIYITAESFSEIGVSEELTPTLYKLVNSGFKFNKFYTPNNLSTIGGEFQSLTGLFADNSILTKWRSGTNYFPYGLGTVFKNANYNTYAYHDNWYKFQDRNKYIKTQGFTNFLGCGNGLEKRMNCNSWPESDLEMMKTTVDDYIKSDKPFMAYYMSVSGHYGYTFSGNNMASKNKKYVDTLPYNENIKAYLATQIELDRAIEYLINKLDENNKLDKTVIVLLADHYPYNLSLANINKISSYQRDSVVEVNHNALIIWNNQLKTKEIDKACMSIDVLPTVLNLFGIAYDSRLIIGKDIFSSSPGIAMFTNHSWVSDKGTYYANKNYFDGASDVSDDYVKNMNNIVRNRINMSRMIVKNNYYNYLLK